MIERRPVKQEITKKKKIKSKKRIALSVKYPSIKAIRDMKQNQNNFLKNILLSGSAKLFNVYAVMYTD